MGEQYARTSKGLSYGSCTGAPFTEMTPLATTISARDECNGLFPASVPLTGKTIFFDLIHATANKNTDPQYIDLRTTGAGTNVTNTQYYAFMTSAAGGTVNVAINGYATIPATACSTGGVELALYSVSSCPAGQSYPTPLLSRTFTGNGTLAAFTGLAGNTSYLLVADGLQNTKAIFNMVLSSATALPLNLLEFQGRTEGPNNLLSWELNRSALPQSTRLERSSNGKDFEPVYEDAIVTSESGTYTDVHPLPGPNYYRLAITTKDGNNEYSKVVVLAQQRNGRVTLAPNPANTATTLYFDAPAATPVKATLYHTSGRTNC